MTLAYVRYSIATDQAATEKIKASKAMSPEMLLEVEQLASEWRRKTQGPGPTSDNLRRSVSATSSARASLG